MSKIIIRLIFFISSCLLMLLAAGCNNDVFLDETPLPDDDSLSATIDGDGGEVSFHIPTAQLEHFGPDEFSEGKKYLTFYNVEGDIVGSESPASVVSRIVYANDFNKYEILKDGNTLTVRSICNTSGYGGFHIRLEYSYGTRFIYISLTSGKPLQLIDVQYPDGMITEDRAKVTTNRFGFTNQGPLPQRVEVRPYLNEVASILVDASKNWAYDKLDLLVPVYVDGQWEFRKKNGIRPGFRFTYDGPDRFTKVDVDIPADSKVNVITEVFYSRAAARGVMTFLNEILDIRMSVDFTVTSYYPVNYEIRVEDAR